MNEVLTKIKQLFSRTLITPKFDNLDKTSKEKESYSTSVVPRNKNDMELMKVFALSVCREYLGGLWKKIELDDFKIEKPS